VQAPNSLAWLSHASGWPWEPLATMPHARLGVIKSFHGGKVCAASRELAGKLMRDSNGAAPAAAAPRLSADIHCQQEEMLVL